MTTSPRHFFLYWPYNTTLETLGQFSVAFMFISWLLNHNVRFTQPSCSCSLNFTAMTLLGKNANDSSQVVGVRTVCNFHPICFLRFTAIFNNSDRFLPTIYISQYILLMWTLVSQIVGKKSKLNRTYPSKYWKETKRYGCWDLATSVWFMLRLSPCCCVDAKGQEPKECERDWKRHLKNQCYSLLVR